MKGVFYSPSGRFILLLLLAVIGVVLLLIFMNRGSAETATFQNPLNPSHGPDPWMVFHEDNYYLAATTWSAKSEPGLTMKSAPTIQELKEASPVSIYTDSDPRAAATFGRLSSSYWMAQTASDGIFTTQEGLWWQISSSVCILLSKFTVKWSKNRKFVG